MLTPFAKFLLLSVILAPVFAEAQELTYSRHDLTFTDPIISQPGTLRLFDGADTDMLVLTRSNDGQHRFEVIEGRAIDIADAGGELKVSRQIDIPRNSVFFAHGQMPEGQREALLVLTETGVSRYDPDTAKFVAIISSPSIFRQGSDLRLTRSGFAQDINDDDRYDFMIPDFDGMKIYLQQGDGTFSGPLVLPVEPEMRLTGLFSNDNISDTEFSAPAETTPTFKVFPSFIFDATGDGRSDVIFVVGRSFKIFVQTADGSFETAPKTIDFAFEARGNRWLDDILAGERNVDQSQFTDITIYRIVDLDADKLPDIVTVNNQASGLFDRKQTFKIYRGRIANGLIDYRSSPDFTYELDGVGGAGFRDVNNDGRKDFVVTEVKINLGKIVSFLLTRKITTTTRYLLDDGLGGFKVDNDFERSYPIGIDLSRGASRNPPLVYEDFTGDGATDLLIGTKEDVLTIYRGGSNDSFGQQIGQINVVLPSEGNLVNGVDVNDDQRADIFVRYSRFGLDGPELRNKMIVFLLDIK